MSLAGTCLRTGDDSEPERVEDVVEKVKSYHGRNFSEKELEGTKPPLKRLYRGVGREKAPEDVSHVMKGIIEGVRGIPAKVFADYCSRIPSGEVTAEEASILIRKMEEESNWARRISLLGEELGLGWEDAKSAYRKGYMGGCFEAIEEAAKFLAYATPDGPKGPRAELASGVNICRVIGWPTSTHSRISRIPEYEGGGIRGLLLGLGLTASRPADHPNIRFSNNDLKRGLYIPKLGGEAYALGLIYGFACIKYPNDLHFSGRVGDEGLFEGIRLEMEGAYNVRSKVLTMKREPREVRIRQKKFNVDGHERPCIDYKSHGLCEHLRKDYGFPTNLEETREARVPRRIRRSSPAAKRRFLKGILRKAFPCKDVCLRYRNKSRRLLKDVKKMMLELGVKPSISIQKAKGERSYMLTVGPTPTRQLVEGGLIDRTQP